MPPSLQASHQPPSGPCQWRSESQAAADFDMDDAELEPRPPRERKAPERIEVDANITSRATGQRWSAQSCCPNHMPVDAEPSTSEPGPAPSPKPKFNNLKVHRPDGQVVPQRQARPTSRGRRQPCRKEHHRQPGRLGARAARLRRDLGGLAAAEEHDAARRRRGWARSRRPSEIDAIQKKLGKVTNLKVLGRFGPSGPGPGRARGSSHPR
jgi:hypothetical protein